MIAVQFQESLQVEEVPAPEPAANEALIRVRYAGICNTDIEITRGYMQFRGTLGHEFVGEVVECALEEWVGRRVVGEINLGCGSCEECRRGMRRHCPNRTVLGILGKDGAMAELVTLPVENLHVVPEAVPDIDAVFVEPLAAALEIAEQVHLQPGMQALVLGDGKLGLLIVLVLRRFGVEVDLLGRHRNKLELGTRFGARPHESEEQLRPKYDLVVEATGSAPAFETALRRTRPRGILVLKSTYAGGIQTDLAPVVINEIHLVGSRCGPFAPALDLLERRGIELEPLISATFPLSEAVAAFQRAQEPGVLKVLLKNE